MPFFLFIFSRLVAYPIRQAVQSMGFTAVSRFITHSIPTSWLGSALDLLSDLLNPMEEGFYFGRIFSS